MIRFDADNQNPRVDSGNINTDQDWSEPLTAYGIVVDGKIDRDRLSRYLIRVCAARFLGIAVKPVGYSFEVILGKWTVEEVDFSLPKGPTKMLKYIIPFEISWRGPENVSGRRSGTEQLFVELG